MHSFARHRHSETSKVSKKETKGLVLDRGWRYDLMVGFFDTFFFRGQDFRELRQRTANLARIQAGEQVLDVGCGIGTLALEVARRVGRAGRVAGIDPGTEQIARARSKATRRQRTHRFSDRGDRATPLPRSVVRCGALYFDDASFTCEHQTSGTR